MKRIPPSPRGLGDSPSLFALSSPFLRLLAAFAVALAITAALGCDSGVTSKGMPKRVPFGGVVKLDGKPITGAVVVFNPEDTTTGTLTQSDTDESGKYELQYNGFPGGTAPGVYKVMISYLVDPDGKAQNMGARSALQMPKSMLYAKERLPKKYSDLSFSELTVTVPPEGGSHDFELTGPLLPLAEYPPGESGTKPADDKTDKADKKEAEASKPNEPQPPQEPAKTADPKPAEEKKADPAPAPAPEAAPKPPAPAPEKSDDKKVAPKPE